MRRWPPLSFALAALGALALIALAAGPAPAQPARPAPPAAAAPAPGAAAAQSELTLESLLARIGGRKEQQGRFVEKKYLALLDAPVESSGTLRYRAPDRLEKNTERPVKESLMLDGDQLVIERNGRRRSLPAAQLPGVAALVGGLRDTLGGDAEALRRVFKVVLQGGASSWQIDLLPSDVTVAQLVTRVTLRGREDRLLEVETMQADRDRSVMTLAPE